MTGTEVAQRTPAQELVHRVRTADFQQQVSLALPSNVPAKRFVRAAVTALLANPDIANAELNSIFQSLLKAAQDGLLPDGREAALVVFKTKDGPKATYLPMIGGFRKIAAEYGWSLRTAVVYEHDQFDVELGADPHLEHRPPRPGQERGQMIAAYAVARHKHFPTEFEVMDATEIEKVRQTSRAKDYGPWADWPERMWEKTVGRRLFKKLPLGERDQERIARIVDTDELEPGQASEMLYGPDQRAIGTASEASNGGATDEAAEAPSSEAPAEEPPGEAEQSFDGDEPPAAESQFKAPEAEKDVVAAGLVEVTFGRNEGRTIADIYADDPGYVSWLCTESVKDAKIRGAAQRFLKGQAT